MKEKVPGIILIVSCQKYRYLRLPKFMPPKSNYNGWKVYALVGNILQDEEYIIKENLIIIRAEDSYLHGHKKFMMAVKVLYSIYDIQQGILGLCDDLHINESALIHFLCSDKKDYMGFFSGEESCVPVSKSREDETMSCYYFCTE